MAFRISKTLFLAAAFAFTAGTAQAQNRDATPSAALNADQIVHQMQQHSRAQNQELKGYKAERHYEVEYRGFAAHVAARMDVEVTFDAATGKSFRVLSQSGSGMLCDKVLKRAIESEKEASQDKASTALSEANYRFRLVGSELVDGHPAYILDVEPIMASKFLFRGRVWVDGSDFAVVKLETEPAQSPSFWISRTLIHATNAKTGDFWLPQQVRSETKVRVGGTATLTINYGTYQVQPEVALLRTGP